jgi:MFS family permease
MLYLICGLTDFAAFIVIFAVSRGLAERQMPAWYLGAVGAGMSFSAGIGSILGGWLSQRFDGRVIFLIGAAMLPISSMTGRGLSPDSTWFLPGYWSLGIALGFLYPPLIGWLNQGDDGGRGGRGVSRTLILFCIAWNVGMMCGQLVAGSLFDRGTFLIFGTAGIISIVNLLLAIMTVPLVRVAGQIVTVTEAVPQDPQTEKRATRFKRLSWIANLGGMFGGSLVIHLLPDLAVTIGIPADRHGVVLATWRSVIIATYVVMHRFPFWHYQMQTASASQLLAVAGLVLVGSAESAVMLLAGLALMGQLVGFNYFSGLFYSTVGSSEKKRALAAGIHEATLATGMAIGTMVGGIAGSFIGHRAPYFLAAAVLLLLVFVQTTLCRRWTQADADPSS